MVFVYLIVTLIFFALTYGLQLVCESVKGDDA